MEIDLNELTIGQIKQIIAIIEQEEPSPAEAKDQAEHYKRKIMPRKRRYIPAPASYRKWTLSDRLELVRLFKLKISYNEMMHKLGRSKQSLMNQLSRIRNGHFKKVQI